MKILKNEKKQDNIEKEDITVVNTDSDETEEKSDSDRDNPDENNNEVDCELSNISLKAKIKRALKYSIHTWIFRCFAIAFGMELLVETLGRRSLFKGIAFMVSSPVVYMYNVSIIFFTLLFALFLRKRVFGLIMISMLWLACGIVNFVVLGYRVTPFAAIDFLMIFDVFSMIDVYLRKWQQILIVIGIVFAICLLIILFRKTPKFEGHRHVKRTMLICVGVWIGVLLFTRFSVKHNIISDDFANLGEAYKDYGFAYCFTNSIIDNGIDKPHDYSSDTMEEIKNELDGVKVSGVEKKPNIIVIQLESFFDPKDVVGLELSTDPVPTFTRLKEEYPSGYFTVPALGAGTANTEFEVLTGLCSSFFGAGEYPYKTTVNDTPVEGLCSILKKEGYNTFAIHNNKSSFYDRKNVYNEMGFDAFISLEYMYDIEETYNGWAKDMTLVDDIMKCLKSTSSDQDFVYTISVQGHGRYPDEMDEWEDHVRVNFTDESKIPAYDYYMNQIYEMDMMIDKLIKELDAYGEDYVLVLYGDHLPSIDLTEDMLPNSTLFQTEYIIVNSININLEDEDIMSYELSTKLLQALNMPYGYAQKAQLFYDDDVLIDKLEMIAYDMLFGEKYIYGGESPVPEEEMKMGVDPIFITDVQNHSDHIVISGENFNEFSVAYCNGKILETIYVDENTLYIEDFEAKAGDRFTVSQVDKSHHVLSTCEEYVY